MDFEQIGKYKIVGQLGHGAMGDVYKAHDPVLNRYVAIKTMSASVAADPELVQRFQREAQSAARLNHPNIVTVYDFGEEHGKLYMSMELLEGYDLKDAISRGETGDLWDQLATMEQICEGLAFAHAQGVVHRDLKPANIHVQPNGRIKIMDFGLARLDTSDMTRTGTVMGTPNYMSPEQVRGQKTDARSDTFSLGAVFYEFLSGHKAFSADGMHNILYKVLDEEPEPIRVRRPDLPGALVSLIARALKKDPAERFQNAGEMRDALRVTRDLLLSGESMESTLMDNVASLGPAPVSPDAPTVLESRGASRSLRPTSGANALDPARMPKSGRQNPTAVPAASRVGTSPGLSTGSKVPVLAGLGTLIVLAGTGAWYMSRAPEPGAIAPPLSTFAPGERDQARSEVLREALVGQQIELARLELDNKSYASAVDYAQRALKAEPQNGEAKDVLQRAQSALTELDSAAAEARRAFQAGDTATASRALGRVLVLDPRHPVAGELTVALNKFFKAEADDARKVMTTARTSADPARSSAPYADASRAAQQADQLLGRQEFAVATAKYLEARDGFDRARRAAELAAKPTTTPRVAIATPPPATLPRPVYTPPPTPVPTAAPVATPPPTPPPTDADIHGAALRLALNAYASALENKNLDAFRQIKPNLSGDEAKRLTESFKFIKSHKVGIKVGEIDVEGNTAMVRVTRQDVVNGRETQAVQQTFRLTQQGGGWVIESIGQ